MNGVRNMTRGPNPIDDEFTYLPISRERKRQLRMRRDQPEKYKQWRKDVNKRYKERKKYV